MDKLKRDDLFKLEDYATARADFRARVLEHKRTRSVALGGHVSLLFEDRLTVQYQVQEMLRVERIFEAGAIQDELDAYNPLIPDGSNLKATMLIEYPEREQRLVMLARLRGVERTVRMEIAGQGSVGVHADEDLPRSTDEKTSAVHFLRFELSAGQARALRDGAGVAVIIDHPAYSATTVLPDPTRRALAADLA